MFEIKKLSNLSRHTEICDVVDRIVMAYTDNNFAEHKYLPEIMVLLDETNEKLISAINRAKTKSELPKFDKIRGAKLQSVYYVVLGFLHNPIEEFRTNAEVVQNILKHYGLKIIKKSYSVKTGLICSLLGDLKKDKVQSAIEALPGLKQLVDELQKAQDTFENERLLFEKKISLEENQPSATTIKYKILKIINTDLVTVLRSLFITDEDKYGIFIRTVAEIINDNNSEVKRRSKRKGKYSVVKYP